MSRRPVFIRYKKKEWAVKDLTSAEYARMCALIYSIETETAKGENPGSVDALYQELLKIAVPSLRSWRIKRMSLVDATAMVTWVIKYYGGDVEKKRWAS